MPDIGARLAAPEIGIVPILRVFCTKLILPIFYAFSRCIKHRQLARGVDKIDFLYTPSIKVTLKRLAALAARLCCGLFLHHWLVYY